MGITGADVFSCAVCRARLSVPVREVHPPAEGEVWTPLDSPVDPCPPRMAAGTFAYDPAPGRITWGPPPKGFGKSRAGHGPGVDPLLSPGDLIGTTKILSRWGGCCGPDGLAGPNLACEGCGAEVGLWIGDCYTWLEVVLNGRLVRRSSAAPASAAGTAAV
ncbi:hypothetical protein PV371_16265 [Streptomyces sp. TX20-6-3]|uniref:hypothetical protein n=1 Tax=Streptomyces sp. TX20-6-3 TaxID=3028705 RepID=UPI0029B1D27F|nr:hypothetical protein [Streptomyces sp. TX20-6-3]MDX2561206.1 hypothetical protein [Streptomyces sp. TX20-6-3]